MLGNGCTCSINRENGPVEPVIPSQLPVEPHEAYEPRNTYLEHLLQDCWRHVVSYTCGIRSKHFRKPCVLFLCPRAWGFPATRDGRTMVE